MVDPSFWAGKRVFVTGHTGFKGAWLCLWLQSMGAQVTGFALPPPTQPSLFERATAADGIRSVTGDVRDPEALFKALDESGAEIVLHLAAQAIVRRSYSHPAETYAINVMGTVNLLDAIRRHGGVKAVVNVTTDKCYENKEWVWAYRENEPMGGYDPYSNSKGCSELVTSAFQRSFFNPADYEKHGTALASARAGNVIGGGDWAQDRLIPDIVRSIERGEPVRIRNPHAVRPWQHVLEPLSGYLLLAERLYRDGPAFAEGWNFGPRDEDAREVLWIVKRLCAGGGDGAGYTIDEGPHPHEAAFLKLDISKAGHRLGWRPVWNLETALSKIVAFVKETGGEPAACRAVCLRQIAEYMQAARESASDTSI